MALVQNILSYRKNCLIHNKPLVPTVESGLRGDKIEIFPNGLALQVHHRQDIFGRPSLTGLSFKFDGTYYRTDVCPHYAVNKPLHVCMICEDCNKVHNKVDIGDVTLDDIRHVQYFYAFELVGGPDEKYDGQITGESIKYHTNDTFYRVGFNPGTKRAICTMGTCNLGASVDAVLKSILKIEVPQFNMDKIENLQQIIDKLKTYAIFS